ncbi:unnamed protein product, partial [marine sediment metagenome]
MNQAEKKKWKEAGGLKLYYTHEGIGIDSIVFDIGSYYGSWAKTIADKYGAHIYGFEPVQEFYRRARRGLKNYSKITMLPFGLGSHTRKETMFVSRDSSSLFFKKGKQETVRIISIEDFMSQFKIAFVDLACINIQGGEYELLNFMCSTGLVLKFNRILLQFHEYENIGSFAEREEIRKKL